MGNAPLIMPAIPSSDGKLIEVNPGQGSNFLLAADIDFTSFFMQYHIGVMPMGTVVWMMEQSIEKYCKAILNKHDPVRFSDAVLSSRLYGHNILNLWNEIKKNTQQFQFAPYEKLVTDINSIVTSTRYLDKNIIIYPGAVGIFTVLCCEFRYEILGKDDFMKKFFGLYMDLLIPRSFLWDKHSYYVTLFQKLMHISIDHCVAFDNLPGKPRRYTSELIKAASKFRQQGTHLEIESDCPVCNKTIWQEKTETEADYEELKKYFCV